MFDFLEFARRHKVELRIEYFERAGVYQIIATRIPYSTYIHIKRGDSIRAAMDNLLKELEITKAAGEIASEKRREIFKKFHNIKD